ncbi:serine/threonine-protein phosphatase [Pseudomonas sp. 7P_10.2_Bac1]|uniref:PP2C family protein-serine/threonine phosphatase n=1 Tax=Pseudomonas sp. 7P_10.2_Bac1 TaxID=2971614 RepID=UPI0021C91161|nr:PP2C family serine/threonine-protein phosphatase [Pseudomonas sp. 7P_10.2_Bac1]MCU1727850.1 serine/threonine-protein phosphatase [Pseudomonas sp. 7P_10.2_Bac1]
MAQWRSAAGTDQGKVRRRNEDAILDCPQHGLWAVADGMGGHRAGDVASQLIVTSLGELTQPQTFEQRLVAVRNCLHWLNRRMGQELTINAQQADTLMGSTVIALLLEGPRGACVWAGDSRCYLWRGQQLYQLSRDHSLQQQLMDEQAMSSEQALAHPGARALTRAVGASEHLSLSVVEFEVLPSDVFLLCSDGLYQNLSHSEIGNALSLISPQVALARMFDGVLRGEARDNFSAVVIRQ